MPADIIIYGIIVIVLLFWLRNVLGTRHGDERQRPNPLSPSTGENGKPAETAEKPGIVTGNVAQKDLEPEKAAFHVTGNVKFADKAAEDSLMQISLADKSFDVNHFANGAQEAFALIVEAFAKGDRETLKPLLAQEIYESFNQVITEREEREETMETEIQAVRQLEILKAWKRGDMAFIRLRFTADEVTYTKDSNGEIVAGDPERVFEMNDVWTFGRNLKSRDPAWLLYETRDDEAEEYDKTPIPDSGDAESN